MTINLGKWVSFAYIVISGLFLSAAGYYGFGWNAQFGFFVGIILSSWHSIYDSMTMIYHLIASVIENDEEIDETEVEEKE